MYKVNVKLSLQNTLLLKNTIRIQFISSKPETKYVHLWELHAFKYHK